MLWMWASWFNISFDQAFFDYVSNHFQTDFGTKPYIVAEASWRFATLTDGSGLKADPDLPIHIDNFYVWGASLNGFNDTGAGVAEVGPGTTNGSSMGRIAQDALRLGMAAVFTKGN